MGSSSKRIEKNVSGVGCKNAKKGRVAIDHQWSEWKATHTHKNDGNGEDREESKAAQDGMVGQGRDQ